MKRAEVAIPARPSRGRQFRRRTRHADRQPREPVADGGRPAAGQLARRPLPAVSPLLASRPEQRRRDRRRPAVIDRYSDFDIDIVRQAWGIKLELHNAPAAAFVDGRMIRGIHEHLFAVLRDILYIHGEVYEHGSVELRESAGITNAVYRVLRNAACSAAASATRHRRALGRTSIAATRTTTRSSTRLRTGSARAQRLHGLRTGCDEGPDERCDDRPCQAAHPVGSLHRPDRAGHRRGRATDAIVNQLAILRDIEKRLEAFVRIGHGIVVFRRRRHRRGNPVPGRHPP